MYSINEFRFRIQRLKQSVVPLEDEPSTTAWTDFRRRWMRKKSTETLRRSCLRRFSEWTRRLGKRLFTRLRSRETQGEKNERCARESDEPVDADDVSISDDVEEDFIAKSVPSSSTTTTDNGIVNAKKRSSTAASISACAGVSATVPGDPSAAAATIAVTKGRVRSFPDSPRDVQDVIEVVLGCPAYKPSETSRLFDALAHLSEDRFREAFFENAPQLIIQLMISFVIGESIGVVRGFSIVSSFLSLALAVADYSANKIKRNPVKRESTALGDLLILFAKSPAIAARCVLVAAYASSASHYDKAASVVVIAFSTAAFALFEYLNLDLKRTRRWLRTNDPKKRLSRLTRFFTRLLVCGFISTFTLLEFRTRRFNDASKEWLDEADLEKQKGDPRRRYNQQLMYFTAMGAVNMAVVYFWFHHIEEKACYFSTAAAQIVIAVVVATGAPISMVFTALFQKYKRNERVTRLGLKAIEALFFHSQNLIQNGEWGQVASTLSICSENEQRKIFSMRDENHKSLVRHMADSPVNKDDDGDAAHRSSLAALFVRRIEITGANFDDLRDVVGANGESGAGMDSMLRRGIDMESKSLMLTTLALVDAGVGVDAARLETLVRIGASYNDDDEDDALRCFQRCDGVVKHTLGSPAMDLRQKAKFLVELVRIGANLDRLSEGLVDLASRDGLRSLHYLLSYLKPFSPRLSSIDDFLLPILVSLRSGADDVDPRPDVLCSENVSPLGRYETDRRMRIDDLSCANNAGEDGLSTNYSDLNSRDDRGCKEALCSSYDGPKRKESISDCDFANFQIKQTRQYVNHSVVPSFGERVKLHEKAFDPNSIDLRLRAKIISAILDFGCGYPTGVYDDALKTCADILCRLTAEGDTDTLKEIVPKANFSQRCLATSDNAYVTSVLFRAVQFAKISAKPEVFRVYKNALPFAMRDTRREIHRGAFVAPCYHVAFGFQNSIFVWGGKKAASIIDSPAPVSSIAIGSLVASLPEKKSESPDEKENSKYEIQENKFKEKDAQDDGKSVKRRILNTVLMGEILIPDIEKCDKNISSNSLPSFGDLDVPQLSQRSKTPLNDEGMISKVGYGVTYHIIESNLRTASDVESSTVKGVLDVVGLKETAVKTHSNAADASVAAACERGSYLDRSASSNSPSNFKISISKRELRNLLRKCMFRTLRYSSPSTNADRASKEIPRFPLPSSPTLSINAPPPSQLWPASTSYYAQQHGGIQYERGGSFRPGFYEPMTSADLWTFQHETGKFQRQKCNGDVPPPTCGATAVVIAGDCYLFGGEQRGVRSNALYRLCLEPGARKKDGVVDEDEVEKSVKSDIAFRWQRLWPRGPQPRPRWLHVSWRWGNRLVVVYGGVGANNEHLNDVWAFNLWSKTWSLVETVGSKPEPRAGCCCAATPSGDVFIFGGFNGKTLSNDLHRLSRATLLWTQIKSTGGPRPPPAYRASLDQVGDKTLLLVGGLVSASSSSFSTSSSAFSFDLGKREWKKLLEFDLQRFRKPRRGRHHERRRDKDSSSALHGGVFNHATATLTDGSKLFVVGGENILNRRVNDCLMEIDFAHLV